jgi:GH24 family phage-related lysozyme (muramidase)
VYSLSRVDNDPLNKVDPLGLRPENYVFTVEYALDQADDCDPGDMGFTCQDILEWVHDRVPRSASSMHMSDQGLWFTAQFEGYISTPDDSAGSCAIGFGTGVWGANPQFGFATTCGNVPYLDGSGSTTASSIFPAPLPVAAAVDFLKFFYDHSDFRQIANRITAPISQSRFDAVMDLAYNHGPYSDAIDNIIDAINEGHHRTAARLIQEAPTGGYDAVGERRIYERILYESGFYFSWTKGPLAGRPVVPTEAFTASNVSRYFG